MVKVPAFRQSGLLGQPLKLDLPPRVWGREILPLETLIDGRRFDSSFPSDQFFLLRPATSAIRYPRRFHADPRFPEEGFSPF